MNERKEGNYVVVHGFMLEMGFSLAQLLVYALLYSFCNSGQKSFYGSKKYIADMLRITERSVYKALSELRSRGLIECKNEGKRAVIYCTGTRGKALSKRVVCDFEETEPPKQVPELTEPFLGEAKEEDLEMLIEGYEREGELIREQMEKLNISRSDQGSVEMFRKERLEYAKQGDVITVNFFTTQMRKIYYEYI